jgi:hypothetical protein
LDSSAKSVLDTLTDDSRGEQAGVILQSPDGKYYSTTPIASADHNHFGMRVQLQKGWKISGIYHTHPGNDDLGQYFSTNDLAVAESLKVPSYIRFQSDGSVRKYTPGQTKTRMMSVSSERFGMRVARGDNLPAPKLSANPPVPTAQSSPQASASDAVSPSD